MKELSEKEYLHRMAAYCSGAERCEQDVRKKIQVLAPDEQDRIVERLRKEGFISDERYAESFVKDKFRFNRWGRIKIAYELRQKGFSSALIERGLQAIDEEKYLLALQTILKDKKRSMKSGDSRADYAKLFRFAASRGFESNLISRALKELGSDEEDTFDME